MDRFHKIAQPFNVPSLTFALVAVGVLLRERCLAGDPVLITLPRDGRTPRRSVMNTVADSPSPLLLPRTAIRVDLKAGEQRTVSLPVINRTDKPLRILSAGAECHCIRVEDQPHQFPRQLAPGQSADLRVLVFGVMPGSKVRDIATDAGAQSVAFQVVVDGHGLGRDVAAQAARQLTASDGLHALALLNDLHGEVRGCGCSGSSFGGLERLPALRAELPAGRTTWWVTGDIYSAAPRRMGFSPSVLKAGPKPAPQQTLGEDSVGDIDHLLAQLSILPVDRERTLPIPGGKLLSATVSDRPEEVLADHDLVITTAFKRPSSAKVLLPQFQRGMGVDLFLLDESGFPAAHYMVPLDGSFKADPAIARQTAAVGENQHFSVVEGRDSQSCAACHPGPYAAWQAGPHSRAFDVLKEADRAASCVVCHTTEHAGGQRVAQVQCQACHQQADAHQCDPRQRTVLRDCLDCHDSRHHPDFDATGAWRQTGRCPVGKGGQVGGR